MMKKLKQNKGETLMEALISLAIAVLAVSLVASAALAAANINKNTRLADRRLAEELEAAETYSATHTSKTLKIDGIGATTQEITVDVYGDGSNFASYK